MKIDVIVIGGGVAGISAALWCDELKLKTMLLEARSELGGQLLHVYNPIKNHLGIETENGLEMRDIFLKQMKNFNFQIRMKSEIIGIDPQKKLISIKDGEEFSSRSIIIASGVRRRQLNIEGEEKFVQNGIIQSGKRDAELVKNKIVCIVGGGDAAFENALILAETAAKVLLVHRSKRFRARAEFVEQAESHRKINIITETVLQKIIGDEQIEAVELKNLNTEENYTAAVQAILIRLGVEPNTKFLPRAIALDENGYIKINQNCETNFKGIYAVGDVANPIAPTVSGAVGMGATAAKTTLARLNGE